MLQLFVIKFKLFFPSPLRLKVRQVSIHCRLFGGPNLRVEMIAHEPRSLGRLYIESKTRSLRVDFTVGLNHLPNSPHHCGNFIHGSRAERIMQVHVLSSRRLNEWKYQLFADATHMGVAPDRPPRRFVIGINIRRLKEKQDSSNDPINHLMYRVCKRIAKRLTICQSHRVPLEYKKALEKKQKH